MITSPLSSIQAGEHQGLFGRRPLPLRESACRLDVEADLFAPLGRLLPGLTALNVGFTVQPQHLAQVRGWGGGGEEGSQGRAVALGGTTACRGTTGRGTTGALQGHCREATPAPIFPPLPLPPPFPAGAPLSPPPPLPPPPPPAGSPASTAQPGSAAGRGRGRARAVRAGTTPACTADGAHAAAAAGVQGSE